MPRMGMNTSEPDSNSWVTINKDVQRISLALNNWFIPCRDSVMELQV